MTRPPTGWHHTEEAKQRIAAGNRGKTHSAETRARIAEQQRQRWLDPVLAAQYRAGNKGKTMSVEARQKISKANRGRLTSVETKDKISAALKARAAQGETRESVLEEAKNRPCADCGLIEPDIMDFDHVPERGAKIGKIGAWRTTVADLKVEIAKCDVVCPNCHRRRTNRRRAAQVVPGHAVFHHAHGRWAIHFDACIECDTTSIKHSSHGRCETCHSRYRSWKRRGAADPYQPLHERVKNSL